MTRRRVFHVTPNPNGDWQVTIQKTGERSFAGGKRNSIRKAKLFASEFVELRGARSSQVIIHDQFGRFSRSFVFPR